MEDSPTISTEEFLKMSPEQQAAYLDSLEWHASRRFLAQKVPSEVRGQMLAEEMVRNLNNSTRRLPDDPYWDELAAKNRTQPKPK